MKKIFSILASAALLLGAVSCEPEQKLENVSIQLTLNGEAFALGGIEVSLTGDAEFSQTTESNGSVTFKVPVGSYTASASYQETENGEVFTINGANSNVIVTAGGENKFSLPVNKVQRSQIIIKELYSTGCPANEAGKTYSNDAYVILYNNSDVEADASDIVFCFGAPYNGHGTNKYLTDGKLLYENENWIPAYNAIWWFTTEVKIPAYSQIVVAVFGGIDHTATVTASVDLSKPEYYLMSNSGITQYTAAKYVAGETIPREHYLTCAPFTQGNAWALSNSSPMFYIGKMNKAEAERLSKDTANYDTTLGTANAFKVVKFPKANVVDAVEIWQAASVEKSAERFSADINTGHVVIDTNMGATAYRNVDAASTTVIPGNAEKLVFNYAADPSGIDAEASLANGAKIVYMDTNNSSKDFHTRAKSSLKK